LSPEKSGMVQMLVTVSTAPTASEPATRSRTVRATPWRGRSPVACGRGAMRAGAAMSIDSFEPWSDPRGRPATDARSHRSRPGSAGSRGQGRPPDAASASPHAGGEHGGTPPGWVGGHPEDDDTDLPVVLD